MQRFDNEITIIADMERVEVISSLPGRGKLVNARC